eukprot:2421844-Prymnesium_polylepis.1
MPPAPASTLTYAILACGQRAGALPVHSPQSPVAHARHAQILARTRARACVMCNTVAPGVSPGAAPPRPCSRVPPPRAPPPSPQASRPG